MYKTRKRSLKHIALIALLALAAASCGDADTDQPEEVVCTDPNFGDSISAMSGLMNGRGFINISRVSGGQISELDFQWDHGATSRQLDDLLPGVYTVTIIDPTGCSVSHSYDLTLDEPEGPQVGDIGEAGGLIVKIDGDGPGLELAPISTIWTGKTWGCSGTLVDTSRAAGEGPENTAKIIETCDEAEAAARLCDALEINGFNEWYLPSVSELMLAAQALYRLQNPDFPAGVYWTSSEVISMYAYQIYIPDSSLNEVAKTARGHVIAMRTFGD